MGKKWSSPWRGYTRAFTRGERRPLQLPSKIRYRKMAMNTPTQYTFFLGNLFKNTTYVRAERTAPNAKQILILFLSPDICTPGRYLLATGYTRALYLKEAEISEVPPHNPMYTVKCQRKPQVHLLVLSSSFYVVSYQHTVNI